MATRHGSVPGSAARGAPARCGRDREPARRDARVAHRRQRRGVGYDNHLGDTATETYDRELGYTLEENSEHVLAEIDAALKRIEDGTYGTCTNCGKEIPEERLEARPWATLCIDCQRERERR